MDHRILFSISFISIIFLIFFSNIISFIPLIDKNLVLNSFGNEKSQKIINSKIFKEERNQIERYKTKIDNSLNIRFPFYSQIIQSASTIDYSINKLMYNNISILKEKPIPLKNGRFMVNSKYIRNYCPLMSNQIEPENKVFDKIERSVEAFNYINREIQKCDISIVLLDYPWTQDLVHKNKNNYKDFFFSKLDKNIKFDIMKNTKENENMFFRTDHHWNIFGAYNGYDIAYTLLKNSYPNISTKRSVDYILLSELEFKGSNARSTAMPLLKDDFYIMKADLPEYKTIINRDLVSHLDTSIVNYLINEVIERPYYAHYDHFYHKHYAEIQYIFNSNSDHPNILIISDSISNCMETLIASHYYNTYILDLRLHNEAFHIQSYIEERNISQILVLGTADAILLSFGINDKSASNNLR